MEYKLKREKEIKDLRETNNNLVEELGEIKDIRQAVIDDHENECQLCLAKQREIDLLKNNQNDLQKKSGKISNKIKKCVLNHEDVKNKLKEKIDLIKIIKAMKEKLEREKKKAAEHRKGVKRKQEDSTKHKSKKLRLSSLTNKKRNDTNRIVNTSNNSYPDFRINCEATDDQKQTKASKTFEEASLTKASETNKQYWDQSISTLKKTPVVTFDEFISQTNHLPSPIKTNTASVLNAVRPVRSSPITSENDTLDSPESGYEGSQIENSKQTDGSEVFQKDTQDSFRDQPPCSISRHSPTEPEALIVKGSTLPTQIKMKSFSNSLLNTIKPVSSSRKFNAKVSEVFKMNGKETPVQAKKTNEHAKFENSQKGVETKCHVGEGLNPQFLKKMMLKRKKLISASTTRMTDVRNASDREVNNNGPPNKKSKSSDVIPGNSQMRSPN